MMNILVTGATGFIGGAVVKRLLDKPYNIKILVRDRKRLKNTKGIIICEGDLRDYKTIEKAVRGVDVVINCAAALPHHKLADKDYWNINALGVQNIVNACQKSKVKRLIHISTVGIYDKYKDAYSRSKLEGEKIIKNSLFNSSTVIIRPTIAYGPGDVRPVFLKLFKMVKKGVNISIGGGKNYFHTVYIDNLVNVILKTIEAKSALGEDFIVGDIICPRMKDVTKEIINVSDKICIYIIIPNNIASLVGKIMGKERMVKFVSENRKYKIDKIKKYLGIKSDIGISIGMKRTFDWYKENNLL